MLNAGVESISLSTIILLYSVLGDRDMDVQSEESVSMLVMSPVHLVLPPRQY